MDKIKIIKKNDEYSSEYQIGDTFEIEGTWYGGVHIIGKTGAPVSLDKDEYIYLDADPENKADSASVIFHPESSASTQTSTVIPEAQPASTLSANTEKMTQNPSMKSMLAISCAISKENGYPKRAPNISTMYWLSPSILKQAKSWLSTRQCMHHSKSVQDHTICL